MICPKCGNQTADDAAFCGVCGTPMGAAAQPAVDMPVQEQYQQEVQQQFEQPSEPVPAAPQQYQDYNTPDYLSGNAPSYGTPQSLCLRHLSSIRIIIHPIISQAMPPATALLREDMTSPYNSSLNSPFSRSSQLETSILSTASPKKSSSPLFRHLRRLSSSTQATTRL